MLDLKSKLLQAGLVTKEQVEKAEQKKHAQPKKKKPTLKDQQSFETKSRQRHVDELKKLPKNEQYDLVRKWVQRNRLDKNIPDLSQSEKFFFQTDEGSVTWLTLDKSVYALVTQGHAGITAFMSHHGLAHCVLPREIVEDIAAVFPAWIRVFKNLEQNQESSVEKQL